MDYGVKDTMTVDNEWKSNQNQGSMESYKKALLNNWLNASCLRWAQVPHYSMFWLLNITTSQLHTYQGKL